MVNDAVAGCKLGFARDATDCDSFPDPCFLTPLEECLFSTSELATRPEERLFSTPHFLAPRLPSHWPCLEYQG